MANKSIKTTMLMCGALGLALTFSHAANAASPDGVCEKAVQSVVTEWNAVDYPSPSKPAAMRVAGKLGHENTAGQVHFMQNQIRLADMDCKQGNTQSALQRISSIQNLLGKQPASESVAVAANSVPANSAMQVEQRNTIAKANKATSPEIYASLDDTSK